MRLFAIGLLVIGFSWTAWDAASGFVTDQHSMRIWQAQHLPPGDSVTRSEASGALRELSLALKDRHRVILIPALLMLTGGALGIFYGKKQGDETAAT